MDKEYEMGSDEKNIKIEVTVGTPASATTTITLIMDNIEDKIIGTSDVDSGNIPVTTIGNAKKLRGGTLLIYICINGDTFDDKMWESVKNTFSIKYKLSGGLDGTTTFDHEKDDIDSTSTGRNIDIKKFIKLI